MRLRVILYGNLNNKAEPIIDENYKNLFFTLNKKAYIFEKIGEQFVLIEK